MSKGKAQKRRFKLMSSLYRKYRPQVFSELVGQDHVRQVLENALTQNKIGHAYLFSGPRGTGKTTTARLLARAVNCTKREKADPCNSCSSCREIIEGRATDIIEIDAASNRGIDEIRDLREKIAFAPLAANYKVYIIDEVHMLTKDAFNALLKTLEEPPRHAIIILATTELQKVPETIVSRCLRLHFHLAPVDKVINLLSKVAQAEKLAIDEEALRLVAVRAEGSYRDALTLLDSLSTQNKKLTAQQVRALVGLPSQEALTRLRQTLEQGKVDELTDFLRGFYYEGGDLSVLVKSLADELKKEILTDPAQATTKAHLLEELLLLLARARSSIDPAALIISTLVSRALSNRPSEDKPAAKPTMTDLYQVVETAPSLDALSSKTSPVAVEEKKEFWPTFLSRIKEQNHALYAVVRSASLVGVADGKLTLAVKFRFYMERLYEAKNRQLVEKIAQEVAQSPLTLECIVRADLPIAGTVAQEEDLFKTAVEVFEIEGAS